MRSRKFSIIFLILFFASSSYADCEKETKERNRFKTTCESAIAASSAAMIGGSILFPIFGGLLGAGPAFIAQNQCRIFKEKEENLKNCIEKSSKDNQLKAAAEELRNRRVEEINKEYDRKRDSALIRLQTEMQSYIQSLINEGYDINDPGLSVEISKKRVDLEAQLSEELKNIELERQDKLAKVS